MSRIGKKPIHVPSGVRVTIDAKSRTVAVEGPKGRLSMTYRPEVAVTWDERARRRNLPWVINNSRFLIFPHVQIPHLASHVLGQLARRVAADWQQQWGFAPLLMETFVDPSRFAGTCYRAGGWTLLGQTSGRGLARPGRRYDSTSRLVLVKPLPEDCRPLLCGQALPSRGGHE